MQLEHHMLQARIVGIVMDGETQGPIQLQHRFVLGQHFTVDLTDAARPRIVDDPPHQQATQAEPHQRPVDDDRILGPVVVRVGAEVDDAVKLRLAGQAGLRRHQRHLPVIIDLGQGRRHIVRQLADRLEKAPPQVVGRGPRHQRLQRGLVLGQHRAQQQRLPVGQGDSLLQRLGVRPDRQALAGCDGRRSQLHPGFQRQHAPGADPQRVDLQRRQLAQVDHHLGHLDQGQRQRVEVGAAQHAEPQPLVDPGLGHHLAGQMHVQRRQAIGQIVDHRRFRPALAKIDHRPEPLARAHPNGHLVGPVAGGHRLQREPIAPGRRGHGPQTRQHRGGRLPHRLRGIEIVGHPAHPRGVRHVGRDDFQGDRLIQAGGEVGGPLG